MSSSTWRKRIKKLPWLISMPSGNVKQLIYLSTEKWRVKIYLTRVHSCPKHSSVHFSKENGRAAPNFVRPNPKT